MSIARKLALLLTMALAAMALAATSASADEGITVAEEGGDVCDPACDIHVVGESRLIAFHVVTASNCTDEFDAVVNANGSGEVTDWDGINDTSACTREQCTDSIGDREHWPFTSEEIATQTVELQVEFCLSPVGDMATKSKCDADVIVTEEESNNHHYFFDLNQECNVGGVPVEVDGHWESEETDVEFVHTP